MKKSYWTVFLFILFYVTQVFAETNLNSLLLGYLKNDLTLQKYMLTAQSKALSFDASKISNGMSFTLSSGTVKIQTSSDGTKYTFTPSASLGLPSLNDTKITASLPVTMKSGYENTESGVLETNGTYLENGNVKLSTGIITSAPLKRKVTLLEAERAYIEAERSAQNQALTVENEFYTNLKSLYNYAAKVLTARKDLYDDEIDLKVLTAQGYSKTSSSYRRKYLEIQSDRRNVFESLRTLERETAIFAVKCGAEYEQVFNPVAAVPGAKADGSDEGQKAYDAVMAFLPGEIPSVEMEDVLSYDAEKYTKSESAAWTKYINELKRKTDYSLEVGAYGGYTFNESISRYDTIDGGITFDWRGITASAGVSLPTSQNLLPFKTSGFGQTSTSPVYTFSISLNPNTWRLSSIDKKQDELNAQIDLITEKSASDDYDTGLLEKLTERGDLSWSEKSYAEEYDMYAQLESDMAKWYAGGSVTESDYLDAKNSREKARINILINAVEKIIYNNNVKMMFVEN